MKVALALVVFCLIASCSVEAGIMEFIAGLMAKYQPCDPDAANQCDALSCCNTFSLIGLTPLHIGLCTPLLDENHPYDCYTIGSCGCKDGLVCVHDYSKDLLGFRGTCRQA